MGQYFVAVLAAGDQKFHAENPLSVVASWRYDNGAKMMEHAYIGNRFVRRVEQYIYQNPTRVVWAGDYAEPDPGGDTNLYTQVEECVSLLPLPEDSAPSADNFRYLVNHSQNLYIDLVDYQVETTLLSEMPVNPLPLLTAEGNGRGGGDYFESRGTHYDLVGSWARDSISIENDTYNVNAATIVSERFVEQFEW